MEELEDFEDVCLYDEAKKNDTGERIPMEQAFRGKAQKQIIMRYSLDFSKKAFKELEKINDPIYSNIKIAISNLTQNLARKGILN